MRSALNHRGDPFPAFPLGGTAREISIGTKWIDLLGESDVDLVMIRVPAGATSVVVHSSGDPLAGKKPTATLAAQSWPLDPGVWTLCTDRSIDGPRFYLGLDPRAGGTDSVTLHVLEAAR